LADWLERSFGKVGPAVGDQPGEVTTPMAEASSSPPPQVNAARPAGLAPSAAPPADQIAGAVTAAPKAAEPAATSAAHALALFSGPGPAAKLNVTDAQIEFHCKRVGRVEPDLARLLLQRYGNFVARHALPHDLADHDG
jgi:hypothetical protein